MADAGAGRGTKVSEGEKANDLPMWEVEEHAQQELGALPNKYDESRGGSAHGIHTRNMIPAKSNLEHTVPLTETAAAAGEGHGCQRSQRNSAFEVNGVTRWADTESPQTVAPQEAPGRGTPVRRRVASSASPIISKSTVTTPPGTMVTMVGDGLTFTPGGRLPGSTVRRY